MGVNTKRTIEVKANIKLVRLSEVTPAQRQHAKKFWTRLIAECQRELKVKSKAKDDQT